MQVGRRVTRATSKNKKTESDIRGNSENIRDYLIDTLSRVTNESSFDKHHECIADVHSQNPSPITTTTAELGKTIDSNLPVHKTGDMPLTNNSSPAGSRRGPKPPKGTSPSPTQTSAQGNKPSGKEEEVTLVSLAKMIKDSHSQLKTQITNLTKNFNEFKEDFTEWQTKTDDRLGGLEDLTDKHHKAIKSHKRAITKVDSANENLMMEMREIRLENKQIRAQLIATQTVLKKVNTDSNIYGRCLKQRNIRLGKIASPITPEIRGAAGGVRQREDTKHVVSEWIVKNELYPGKDINGMKQLIDVAYRTGKPSENRVRNILVVFNRISDRNIVMRAGKIKEREKELGGAYLMDDMTNEDYSIKERCHGLMKKYKDEEKKPIFMYGSLKNKEGAVSVKTVKEFNKSNSIIDKRSKEVTVENLTMHLIPKRKRRYTSSHRNRRG